MARAPLPDGLLEVYRDATWVNPVDPATALSRLLDWLDDHPADAATLLPEAAAWLKARRGL